MPMYSLKLMLMDLILDQLTNMLKNKVLPYYFLIHIKSLYNKLLCNIGVLGDVAWNFAGKFIVDKNGKVLPVKSEKDLEATIMKLASE